MLIFSGNQKQLKQQPWFCLIVTSESTIETTLRHVGLALRKLNNPIELFVPFEGRQPLYGPYLYIRGTLADIHSLVKIPGVQEIASTEKLIKLGGGEEPLVERTPITLPDVEVQAMIERSKQQHRERASKIKKGSFVRILDGQARSFCGTVKKLNKTRATVNIEMFSRTLTVETPAANLEALEIPAHARMFYFCDAIQRLLDENRNIALPIPSAVTLSQ